MSTMYDPEHYWRERYRKHGRTYVARANRPDVYERQVDAITPYFRYLPENGRVLDFGCGPERFREPLEERGLEYVGVDLIDELGTHEIDALEPESFDAALAIFVLQHIGYEDTYRAAVSRIRELLKPGGVLLVVDHQPEPVAGDHMHPRGPAALAGGWSWAGVSVVGAWNGHWIGVFTR